MIISLCAEKQPYFNEKAKSKVTQTNLHFFSFLMQDFKWCPLHLDKAKPTRIWAGQVLNLFPPSKHVKYVAHYSCYRKHYTHILDLHSSIDHFEHSVSLLSGSVTLIIWHFNGLTLKVARVGPLSKLNSFKVFLLAVLKETVYTHYATLFYEAPSFKNKRKNEADWTQRQCPGRQKEMGTSWNVNLLAAISR